MLAGELQSLALALSFGGHSFDVFSIRGLRHCDVLTFDGAPIAEAIHIAKVFNIPSAGR